MTTHCHFIHTTLVLCVTIQVSSEREIDKLSKVKQHNVLFIYRYQLQFFTGANKCCRDNLCPQFGKVEFSAMYLFFENKFMMLC